MIDQTISHYKIIDKLGEGGMGIVYKALDTSLDRTVALKFLPAHLREQENVKQRFIREAKAVAALNHPNICTIHTVDEYDGIQFIVMEFIEGITLREKLTTEHLELQTVLDYATQISAALKEAHINGIIHRDIKSDNIMLTSDDRIKVMDFGLAKLKGATKVTKTGKTAGTVTYMSPEQIRGEQIDERSDIWSFGIVMYEMLCGEVPFTGNYDHAVMYSILNEDPVPISNTCSKFIPPGVEKLVTRCIAKDPSERYQSTTDLLNELTHLRKNELPQNNKSGDRLDRIAKQGRLTKRRMIITGFAGIFLFLIFAFLYMPERTIVNNGLNETFETESIRLMVLPFTNIGGDPNRQMFCDGLVETITSNLTQVEQMHKDLWVIPAQVHEDLSILSSGEVQRHFIKSPGEAHRTYGVNYAVTGSLQPLADQLRLTVHLVDAKNLRQINSAVIDVDASDVLALHDKSVEHLMAMLNLELRPETREIMKAGLTKVSAAFELYTQGKGYLQRFEKIENINNAIRAFEQSVELDPNFALAYTGLGQAYWRKYDYTRESEWLEKANEHARAAYQLDNKLAQVNITLGIINTGTGRYDQAIEKFNNVLAIDPTNAEANRELARAYESVGDIEEAEATNKRAIRLKPDDWAGYSALGTFYFRHNRYDDAIEQFKKVLDITPDNHHAYINLGAMYYFLDQLDDARQMFEHSLEIEETYDALSNLGTLYFMQGRYGEAIHMYESALEIHSGNYLVWGNLGSAYYWKPGEREKAEPAYKRAIELAEIEKETNPNDPYVTIDLAAFMAMTGNEKNARKHMQKALDMAPGNTWVMLSASTTFEYLGERDKAMYWIEKAIELGHSLSEIKAQPILQDLISDDRFQEFIENL